MAARFTPQAAAFALLLGALTAFGAPASAQTVTGFTVTGNVSIEHVSLTVNGPITVSSGGALTLIGVDLTLAPSATQAAALVVEPGGSIVMADSTIRAAGADPAQAVRVELRGTARIERSAFYGLAPDTERTAGRALEAGPRVVPGGLLVYSSEVLLDSVLVRGSLGCGVTVKGASPMLRDLDVSSVAYGEVAGNGYAAALCIEGGSPTVERLRVSTIGSSARTGLGALTAAGIVADAPVKLTILGLEASNFAPPLAGLPAPRSIAIAVQDPRSSLCAAAGSKA